MRSYCRDTSNSTVITPRFAVPFRLIPQYVLESGISFGPQEPKNSIKHAGCKHWEGRRVVFCGRWLVYRAAPLATKGSNQMTAFLANVAPLPSLRFRETNC